LIRAGGLLLATIFCFGCGHAASEAEARRKLASQFANPALGCLTAQAPPHARFYGVRPGRHQVVESLTVAWPNGESLTMLAPAGGRVVAQAALPRLRAEQAKQGGTQPPERHGAVVTIWSKAPSREQAELLGRCVR
jgi:hypothetical protein